MSVRVEAVINKVVRRSAARAVVDVPISRLPFRDVQVVIDRTLFEDGTTRNDSMFWARIFNGSQYLGGAEFAGGKIDVINPLRPGQRMLWSFGRWPLPPEVTRLTVEIEGKGINFPCLLHVDFLD